MVPISLDLKNFFSHKDSYIDFTLFESALLIGNTEGNYDISNGCGKSAIFEGILWCLFNKARVAAMDDVIYWGESGCKVTFTFRHGPDIYRVTRRRHRTANTSNVEFSRQDPSGAWVDVSGSTPSLTNDEIIKTIRFDYKTFVNSAYFRQNDISEFTETDASRKKEILKSIIDISKWDEYEDQVRSSLKELRSESKILESKVDGYEELVAEFSIVTTNLENSKELLNTYTNSRNDLAQNLELMNIKYQELKSKLDTNTWDKTVESISELSKKKATLTSLQSSLSKKENEYSEIVTSKSGLEKEINSKISSLVLDDGIEEKITENNNQIIELKASLSSSKQMIKNLQDIHLTHGSCYVCQQAISEELHNKLTEDHKAQMEKHAKEVVFCQNKIKELEQKAAQFEELKNNKKKADILQAKLSSALAELKVSRDRLEEVSIELKNTNSELFRIDEDVKIHNQTLESLRDASFKNLQNSIHNTKKELEEVNSNIEKTNRDIGGLNEKSANLEARIKEKDEVKKLYVEKQKQANILEKMIRLLGKNGIQTILLNAIIEDLEKTANEILISICNESFQVFLDTQRLGSDGVSIVDTLDLRVKKDGVVQNFKSLSGGEQFRISLALRIALSEISSRHGGSALEFLLLDEINSPLDRQGTESLFLNVIKSLEKKYKILVITHNDSLKERFADILDVTKVNGESSVSYTSA